MARIDLNGDVGEGAGQDAALMPLLTSANIACGIHAGDVETMQVTIELARRHGVAIGAHPSLNDREHFGRRELPLTPAEAHLFVLTQTRLLQIIARQCGARVAHVKPHGALYNMAARDPALAAAVAAAVREADPALVLFGLAGSRLTEAGRMHGLRVANEVFADRTYRSDGSLTPRNLPGALIQDVRQAAAQVRRMVKEGRVKALDGTEVAVAADTVCLHGDGPDAVGFATRLRQELLRAGIAVQAFGS
ncbi:MAG: LamB/YcsF family protein [Opitutaceae bacterium]|nr:LamB/YcsF family protein [Opitutaceae bacterium]